MSFPGPFKYTLSGIGMVYGSGFLLGATKSVRFLIGSGKGLHR